MRNGKEIHFNGLIEEIWAKYGKDVYYRQTKSGYFVTVEENGDGCYANDNGYFDMPEQIKFNVIAHSSGGLAIREYIRLMYKENRPVPLNSIINLSVPQKGARLVLGLENNFPGLIRTGIESFYNNVDTGTIEFEVEGRKVSYNYSELEKKTRIGLLKDKGFFSKFVTDLLSAYILYFIPFDGRKRVLANDPALYDLNPEHRFIKVLNKTPIPEDIKIYNYKVRAPYARMFEMLARSSGLGDSDGVVDYLDTSLDNIPDYEKLHITDIEVDKANHIPMPYIKPLFELRDTVEKKYGIMKLLVKSGKDKEENIDMICALFFAIFKEMDFIPEDFIKNKNYSVIDYFAENPVVF